jgi:peptide chain release factor
MKDTEHLSLLVTSGDGPAECNQAVNHILNRMQDEADMFSLALSIHRNEGELGPKSAVVVVHGSGRHAFAKSWSGTVQWRMESQLRKHHKRSNWFVGVFLMDLKRTETGEIRPNDVTFSTLRAGGPGGQHQNTTDSAVRAVHTPSGHVVVVREARSQHRNKALALTRLQALADAQAASDHECQKYSQNRLHHALERGNPVRRFVGQRFKEDVRLK